MFDNTGNWPGIGSAVADASEGARLPKAERKALWMTSRVIVLKFYNDARAKVPNRKGDWNVSTAVQRGCGETLEMQPDVIPLKSETRAPPYENF